MQKAEVAFTITIHYQVLTKNTLAERSGRHFLRKTNWKPETAPIFTCWRSWAGFSKFWISGRTVS